MDTLKTTKAHAQRMLNAQTLSRELVASLGKVSSRNVFLQTLSRLFRQQFSFDRLCINLYDPNSELLSYFTAAEGAVINSLSPIRKAEKNTWPGTSSPRANPSSSRTSPSISPNPCSTPWPRPV